MGSLHPLPLLRPWALEEAGSVPDSGPGTWGLEEAKQLFSPLGVSEVGETVSPENKPQRKFTSADIGLDFFHLVLPGTTV